MAVQVTLFILISGQNYPHKYQIFAQVPRLPCIGLEASA
jgi:hypothetical protein